MSRLTEKQILLFLQAKLTLSLDKLGSDVQGS